MRSRRELRGQIIEKRLCYFLWQSPIQLTTTNEENKFRIDIVLCVCIPGSGRFHFERSTPQLALVDCPAA